MCSIYGTIQLLVLIVADTKLTFEHLHATIKVFGIDGSNKLPFYTQNQLWYEFNGFASPRGNSIRPRAQGNS